MGLSAEAGLPVPLSDSAGNGQAVEASDITMMTTARVEDAATAFARRLRLCDQVAYWLTAVVVVPLLGIILTVILPIIQGFVGGRPYTFVYRPLVGKAGFLLHAVPGALYFALACFQFHAGFRRHYPHTHRLLGYIYYACVVILLFGIILIGIAGPESGWSGVVAVILGVPFWGYLNGTALYYAIKGDVPRHRAFNLRALQLALAVIWMRILLALVVAAGLESDGFNALKAILWLTWMVTMVLTEMYLRWEKGADLPGTLAHYGMLEVDRSTFRAPLPLQLWSVTRFNDRTALCRFRMPSGMALRTRPGEHIAITALLAGGRVTRPYSPVTSSADAMQGYVDLIIRLVPGGRLTPHLFGASAPSTAYELASIHASPGLRLVPRNEGMALILYAGGTGLTPLLPFLAALLAASNKAYHPDDTSPVGGMGHRVVLLFKNRSQADVFYEQELQDLQHGHPNLTVRMVVSGETAVADDLRAALESVKQWSPSVWLLAGGPPALLRGLRQAIAADKDIQATLSWEHVYLFGYSDR